MPPRAISVLTIAQLLVIFLGILFTGLFMKLPDWQEGWVTQPALPNFVRHHGFWLCLLTLGWAVSATVSVCQVDDWPEIPSTAMTTGYVLLASLIILLGISGLIAVNWTTTFQNPMIQRS